MRRIAAEVIDRMGRTDVAAVICTYDVRCAQDFTNDRTLLKAAVAKFAPKSFAAAPLSGGRYYDWYRQTAGVTTSIVKSLIEGPGRRKALIYVSPNLPVRPVPWPPPCCDLEKNVTDQQVIRAFEDAFRSKVTVYGISPAGMERLSP
jgi:hypothetical protein